jgi:hypothetical protein
MELTRNPSNSPNINLGKIFHSLFKNFKNKLDKNGVKLDEETIAYYKQEYVK